MKVSVAMITYNHEQFVAQAIESALMQKTDFDFEVVIGEDCSTDRTREIVVDYQKSHPDRIRLLSNKKNIGLHKNFIQTLRDCRGQYIALLEGDDYWTDPYKLQKQLNFLEQNPEYTICFHAAKTIWEDDNKKAEIRSPPGLKETYTVEDLLTSEVNFIATCSAVFRNGMFKEFPDWFFEMQQGDWPLHILNALNGDIRYIDEVMGVYRVHKGGVWSQQDLVDDLKKRINSRAIARHHLAQKYSRLLKITEYKLTYTLFRTYLQRGDRLNAKNYARKGFIGRQYCNDLSFVDLSKLFLQVCMPTSFKLFSSLKRRFLTPI